MYFFGFSFLIDSRCWEAWKADTNFQDLRTLKVPQCQIYFFKKINNSSPTSGQSRLLKQSKTLQESLAVQLSMRVKTQPFLNRLYVALWGCSADSSSKPGLWTLQKCHVGDLEWFSQGSCFSSSECEGNIRENNGGGKHAIFGISNNFKHLMRTANKRPRRSSLWAAAFERTSQSTTK